MILYLTIKILVLTINFPNKVFNINILRNVLRISYKIYLNSRNKVFHLFIHILL